MITNRLISLVAIFIVVTTNVFAFECPIDQACNCQNFGDRYKIYCPLPNGSSFNVEIQPDHYVQVECYKSPKWSDFHINVTSLKKVKTILFRWCDLPPSNTSLSEITQTLGAIDVEKLIFQSFMNLSFELTKHHLDGFENLKRLILWSNMISYLDKDLLVDLPNLIELNLMGNNINLPTGFFNNTPKLEWLELSGNNLQSIKLGTFDNLKKLQLLNLWNNNLTQLQSGIFDGLTALSKLDINTNNLVTLREDVFAKLENLEVINLSRNYFTQLPKDLLRNNKKLNAVIFFNNKGNMTTLPDGFFSNFTELKTLKLESNGFDTLPEDLFWGSFSLTNVTLTQNRLKSLPENIFRDSKHLTKLILEMNKLETLHDNTFSSTNRLKELDLSRNHLTSISSNLFKGLGALRELNIERNRLTYISDTSFSSLKNLKIARFSNNYLTLINSTLKYHDEFGMQSPFYACTLLEELHLANNNISEIFRDWILTNLKLRILDLKYNNISIIRASDLQFMSNPLRVDLTHNNIHHLIFDDAERVAEEQKTPRDVIIQVENNPLICDCFLYDFLRYLEGKMNSNVQNYFHVIPGNLTCRNSNSETIDITKLESMKLTCMASDLGVNITCPEKCDCMFRPADKAFIVDCSRKNLTLLSNNVNFGNLSVFELDFSGNELTQMPNLKKFGLTSVKRLDLSHNNISEILLDGLSNTIKELKLHNNNISRIRPNVVEFLNNSTNLTRLTLHGNPWKCDCNSISFMNLVQAKFVNIIDLPQVMCYESNQSISKMTTIDFCPNETELIIGFSVAIALIGLFIGIFGFYYRYQNNIKVWLYAHQWCLWLVTEEELDKDKLYDAFISYSHKDQDFVENELVSKLESGPKPFKLCLHYRDWIAGEWIPTQIAKSVEDSRRTIVVLSPDFLESVWGRLEFRTAHCQALSDGRARVILILYGDIGPTDDMDPELKAYISMNTYVKWGDPWFWHKLRYALPHPPKYKVSSTAQKIYENHQLYLQLEGDKKELIYPVGVSETPLANTTPPADTLKTFICDEKEQLHNNGDTLHKNGDIAIIFEPNKIIKQDPAVIDNPLRTTVC